MSQPAARIRLLAVLLAVLLVGALAPPAEAGGRTVTIPVSVRILPRPAQASVQAGTATLDRTPSTLAPLANPAVQGIVTIQASSVVRHDGPTAVPVTDARMTLVSPGPGAGSVALSTTAQSLQAYLQQAGAASPQSHVPSCVQLSSSAPLVPGQYEGRIVTTIVPALP